MTDFTLRDTDASQAEALLNVEVVAVEREAEGVVSLELGSAAGGRLPAWTPGAHIDVILPNGLVRQYSLCSDHEKTDTWRIAVLREPSSRGGSIQVHDSIRAGDTIQVSQPRNNFQLENADHYLFIAGGIGITPILPMVRQAAATGKPWTLLYGGRTRGSMAFLEEIAAIPGGTVHIQPQDEFGLLDLKRFLGTHTPGTTVYCCGPGPLIDAVENNCSTWPAGTMRRERFTPKAKPVLEKGAFEIELARSGKRLTVPPYKSVLSVLQEAGVNVTNSCTAGICGTCLVKVLAGVPQHNDDVLSNEERASNSSMLVCVSRAEGDLLVLDL